MARHLVSRRRVLQSSLAVPVVMGLPSLSHASKPGPNDRIRIAAVGATNRGGANISEVAHEEITILVDCDNAMLDKGSASYPNARKYQDWRVMFDKEEGKIDAVVVSTADHNHAPIAARALRMGLPVYCEKPLTHTVKEARVLAELAKEKNLATQMGTQIHAGDNYRRVVELIKAGAIGPVREVHVWANAVYTGAKFNTNIPKPESLNWDVWLGPAMERPYSGDVHPFQWRKFWDYGSGTLGDFGCHFMDLVHWALDLRGPEHVAAEGPPVDAVSAPAWCKVKYQHAARGERPAVTVHWYDSGKRPDMIADIMKSSPKDQSGNAIGPEAGQLFIGDKGMLLSNYGQRCLLPGDKFADYKAPEKSIPDSIGHHREWLHAIRTGDPTTCNFDYSGALTETVCLGTASYRSGQAFQWDSVNLKAIGADKAQQFIDKEYRKGWTL